MAPTCEWDPAAPRCAQPSPNRNHRSIRKPAFPGLTKNNPDVLKTVADGWFKALDYVKSNPDDAYTIMAKAFNVSKQEMIDFKSVMTWYSKDDNISMFNRSSATNVYQIFQLVGDVLEANGSAKLRFKPEDKITNVIIDRFK